MARKRIDEFPNKPLLSDTDLILIEDSLGVYHHCTRLQLFTVDVPPTYVVAVVGIAMSSSPIAEVGTAYTNTLTASFTPNNAGSLSTISIQKNGVNIMPTGVALPFSKVDTDTYPNGSHQFRTVVSYLAGALLNYTPSGNPDARTPLIRNVNAPQAAETGFASTTLFLTGYFAEFYGPTAVVPTNSATARALPSNRLTNAGTVFLLNTGTVEVKYCIVLPPGKSIVSVIDLDALNLDITASYISSVITVNDAGGTPRSYTIYTMASATPYATNHRHQVTTN